MKKENKSYTALEACFYGMDAIFKHHTTEDLHHKKLIKDLKDKQFKIEKISLVKLIDGLNCDVIAKDPKGFRSYHVSLEKNAKFPHLYRIYDVRGQKIVSRYQWENR